MAEAIIGLALVGALVSGIFVVDLLLTRRQRRRLAADADRSGTAERRGGRRAANEAGTASRANGMSSTTYLG